MLENEERKLLEKIVSQRKPAFNFPLLIFSEKTCLRFNWIFILMKKQKSLIDLRLSSGKFKKIYRWDFPRSFDVKSFPFNFKLFSNFHETFQSNFEIPQFPPENKTHKIPIETENYLLSFSSHAQVFHPTFNPQTQFSDNNNYLAFQDSKFIKRKSSKMLFHVILYLGFSSFFLEIKWMDSK